MLNMKNREDVVLHNPASEQVWKGCIEQEVVQSLQRAFQPLMKICPELPGKIHQALKTAEEMSYVFGTLTRHEFGAIVLCLQRTSEMSFIDTMAETMAKQNFDNLRPYIPYILLLLSGLHKLPLFFGNVWTVTDGDLTEVYTVGRVFAWQSFIRCRARVDSSTNSNSKKRTLFNILTTNGRIVQHLSNQTIEGDVILLPESYFQVISVCHPNDYSVVIHVRQIQPPAILTKSVSSISIQVSDSRDSYWIKVLENVNTDTGVKTALRIINTAVDLADVGLLESCLQRLSEFQSLQCSCLESTTLLSAVLDSMEVYKAYSTLHKHAFSVLALVCKSKNIKSISQVGEKAENVILGAIRRHINSAEMVKNALQLLCLFSTEVSSLASADTLLNAILRAMSEHPDSKFIQLYGCFVLFKLLQSPERISKAIDNRAIDIVLNAVILHRDDTSAQQTCWHTLFCLHYEVNHNNKNEADSPSNTTEEEKIQLFLQIVKKAMRTFFKETKVQAEGLGTLWRVSQEHHNCDVLRDSDTLNIVIRALRLHNHDAQVAEYACLLLAEMSKSPLQTQLVVSEGGISSMLSTMNHHFNVASIQESGAKFLRNLAMNGLRGYLKEDKELSSGEAIPREESSSLPDYRLKVVESGGIDIILSAMRTHGSNVGVQRQGCLALRTLCVTSTNFLDTKGVEEIHTVMDAFSTHLNSKAIQTGALRALSILIIDPANREIMEKNDGAGKILTVLKTFPNSSKIQEEGLGILIGMSTSVDVVLSLFRKRTISHVFLMMEMHPSNKKILTSSCQLLADMCLIPLRYLKDEENLPTVVAVENAGFEKIESIMIDFQGDQALQIQGCRVLASLAVSRMTLATFTEITGLKSVFNAMTVHSTCKPVLEAGLNAVYSYIAATVISDQKVRKEVIEHTTSVMTFYPQEQKLQRIGIKTLEMLTRKGASNIRRLVRLGAISNVLMAMKHHMSCREIQWTGLRALNNIASEGDQKTLWQLLVPFWNTTEEKASQTMCVSGGFDTVIETMKKYFSDSEILHLSGQLFASCYLDCCNVAGFPTEELQRLAKEVCFQHRRDTNLYFLFLELGRRIDADKNPKSRARDVTH